MRTPATGWRLRRRLAAAATAAASLAAAAALTGAAPATASARTSTSPAVTTASGAVQGTTVSGVQEFLGIPYAAPPVGSLRWQPPAPPASWSGVRPATAYGPHCAQAASPFGTASTSEDCLYLNVFTAPGGSPAGRPVMVWLHGGALVAGESDTYDPTPLVNDGVTVVTLNYRLGQLGFLADSALASAQGDAGNYGLMDQQAALRWVQQNIAAFGGNPRDVTLFGESAGGLSVLSQLTSPGAAGLFQRAIIESGSYDLTQTSLAASEAQGAQFASAQGCTQSAAAQVAACLRALPVSAILASQTSPLGVTPNVDGAVLRQPILTALETGRFSRVPVIMGTNHDEWRLFVALAQLAGGPAVTAGSYQQQIESLMSVPAAIASEIMAQYPLRGYASPAMAYSAAGTDAVFACPSLEAVSALSLYTPTYAYEFNDENAPQPFLPGAGFPYGATHTSELPFLFSLTGTPEQSTLSSAEQTLAGQMQGYWTSQARSGTPETAGQPAWPLFNAITTPMLSLSTPTPAIETNFSAEHNCTFWSGIASQIAGAA
jgi:para-nitrobenzyl esterase